MRVVSLGLFLVIVNRRDDFFELAKLQPEN